MTHGKGKSIEVRLSRGTTAPRRPTRQTLAALFKRAWQLTPSRNRPRVRCPISVNLWLVKDREIARLNAAHLGHRGPTDVLSFPMGEFDPVSRAFLLGEIVVSHETARREAAERGLSVEEELSRYCVHGFLHLLGYDDRTPLQRKKMLALQEKTLCGS